MLTFSSREVTADSGAPSLLDIGIHLGRIPRWAAATKSFYPVLLHAMTVADLLPLKHQIHGLLHDSDESVTEDVPGPIKPEELRRLQQKIRVRIYKELGFTPPSDEVEALVKRADVRAQIGEAHVVGPAGLRGKKQFLPRDLPAEKIVAYYAGKYEYEDYLEPGGRAVEDFVKRCIAAKG